MIKKRTEVGKYRIRMSAAIHETAAGLHRIGLMDEETIREFDASCLTPSSRYRPRKSLLSASGLGSARACSL
jgi:hypothetical protein